MHKVFVIGCPKSGTSLVMSLLDFHTELAVITEESDLYPELNQVMKSRIFKIFPKKVKIGLILNFLSKKSHFRNYATSGEVQDISGNFDYSDFDFDDYLKKVKFELSNLDKINRKNSFNIILEILAQKINKNSKYLIEKTPRHTFFIDEIVEDFGEVKFIYVERNFSDNFNSYKVKHRISLEEFSDLWYFNKCTYEKIRKSREVLKIQYETLVDQTDKVLNDITRFLNINHQDTLYQPSKLGKIWYGNSMFKKSSNKIAKDRLNISPIVYDEPQEVNLEEGKIFTNYKRPLITALYNLMKLFYE